MTTAIIGTGGIGSAIARQLAGGGETLQLSSADRESAQKLAAAIGGAPVVALDNRSALQGADAVILALRFSVLKNVIDEISDMLGDTSLVVPSNPVGLDAQGKVVRLRPEGQSSGQVVAGWLLIGTRFAIAFGTMSVDLFESSSHRSPEPSRSCSRLAQRRYPSCGGLIAFRGGGASKRDRIRSDVVNSRLPDPRLERSTARQSLRSKERESQ